MGHSMRLRDIAGPIVLAAAVGALAAPLTAQQPRDLSGRWELRDRARRDSAVSNEAEAPATAERPAGRPRGGRSRGGRRSLSEKDRLQIGRLLGMAQVVPAFEIEQTDSTITVINESGFSYTVYPDGRETELRLGDDPTIEVKARWKEGHLVVEYKPEGGGKLTETYALADSGLFLRLEVAVEHSRLPRQVWQSRMYRKLP